MSRRPTLDDAFLLALSEAKVEGLDIVKWYLKKPEEFKESLEDFTEKIHLMKKEGLVDLIKFGDSLQSQHYKLTEKGKFKANNLEKEIDQEYYIKLVANFSPDVEIRKRIGNIETFIVSCVFLFSSFFILRQLVDQKFSFYISMFFLLFYMIIFVVSLIYFVSSFTRILAFWGYYTARYGKIINWLLIYYKNNEKNIRQIFKFVILPSIALLISIFGLNLSIEYAVGTFLLTIIGEIILRK